MVYKHISDIIWVLNDKLEITSNHPTIIKWLADYLATSFRLPGGEYLHNTKKIKCYEYTTMYVYPWMQKYPKRYQKRNIINITFEDDSIVTITAKTFKAFVRRKFNKEIKPQLEKDMQLATASLAAILQWDNDELNAEKWDIKYEMNQMRLDMIWGQL